LRLVIPPLRAALFLTLLFCSGVAIEQRSPDTA
jgi:hypothetical protein